MGAAQEIQQQITGCKVTPAEAVTTTDAVPTLDGGEVAAEEERTFTSTISGNVFQDLTAAGIVDWSWEHAGEEVECTFVPTNSLARGVFGHVFMVPIEIGGDEVKARMRSDFTWRFKEPLPTFGVYDAVDDSVEEDV